MNTTNRCIDPLAATFEQASNDNLATPNTDAVKETADLAFLQKNALFKQTLRNKFKLLHSAGKKSH
ncbi:MAG: hypothetical protein ACI9J5_001749 [Paraglaciecola sp.]|jgi:hypothetical protein